MNDPDPPTSPTHSITNQDLNVFVTYEDAKKFVDLGFSVIPINPRDKTPAIASWKQYQERKPTNQELHEWFDRGDKNIAIVCGRISRGFVVVDFDDPSILAFLVSEGIETFAEKTTVVRTGRGYQVYYRVPESQLKTMRFENLKIDIKGEASYVVAPPSIHKNGRRYEFINNKDIEYNENFDKFLEVLEQKDYEFKYAKVILPYWEPSKRNYLDNGLTVFFKIKENWSLEKILEFMLGINRMKPFPEDPHTESEIIAKVKNAYEKEYNYKKFLSKYLGTDELLKQLESIAPKNARNDDENLYICRAS